MFPARILPPGTGGKKFLLLVAGTASGSAGSGLFSRFLGSAAGSRSFSGLFGCAASCGSLSRLLGSAACSSAGSRLFFRLLGSAAGCGSLDGFVGSAASGGRSFLFLFLLTPSEQVGKCHCDILLRFRQSLFVSAISIIRMIFVCTSTHFFVSIYALFCKYLFRGRFATFSRLFCDTS